MIIIISVCYVRYCVGCYTYSNVCHIIYIRFIVDILRLKNGFNASSIPKTYKDIKLNLIAEHNEESIVGEIQFILKPMLDNKKRNHELYEIKRLKDIIKMAASNKDTNNSVDNNDKKPEKLVSLK